MRPADAAIDGRGRAAGFPERGPGEAQDPGGRPAQGVQAGGRGLPQDGRGGLRPGHGGRRKGEEGGGSGQEGRVAKRHVSHLVRNLGLRDGVAKRAVMSVSVALLCDRVAN